MKSPLHVDDAAGFFRLFVLSLLGVGLGAVSNAAGGKERVISCMSGTHRDGYWDRRATKEYRFPDGIRKVGGLNFGFFTEDSDRRA